MKVEKVKIWHNVNKNYLRNKDGEILVFETLTDAENYILISTEIPFSELDFEVK